MAKTKIQIKSIFGKLLFEHETEDNTIKKIVEEAVKNNAYLRGADLRGADLRGADLRDANLRDAYLRGADLRGADLRGADLRGADLRGADLRDADLRDANLRGADLRDADLRGADLRGADLRGADLRDAYLRGADLRGADLRDAYLRDADLRDANLRDAYLRGADLRDADLRDADLRGANDIPFIPLACPSDGTFIGWKKVAGQLVKLEIPEDARRCSATTNKCRCDKAMVLSIVDIKTGTERRHITNDNYARTTYTVGKMVYPDSFDDNRWNECSHGIHFFINKQEAIDYEA